MTYVLSPSCYPPHSDRRRSCPDGTGYLKDHCEQSPWYPARGQRGLHGEHSGSCRLRCSRQRYARAAGHLFLCIHHRRWCRARQRQPPRILHLSASNRQHAIDHADNREKTRTDLVAALIADVKAMVERWGSDTVATMKKKVGDEQAR